MSDHEQCDAACVGFECTCDGLVAIERCELADRADHVIKRVVMVVVQEHAPWRKMVKTRLGRLGLGAFLDGNAALILALVIGMFWCLI